MVRLPPVDSFRLPLIEPLGHLVLHAAWLDNELIEFVAMLLPYGPDTTVEQVAHELRNWNAEFLKRTIDRAAPNAGLASDFHQFVDRLKALRDRRHRAIHDAMEVGIDTSGSDGRARSILLSEGYQRKGKMSEHALSPVTPEDIGAIASEYYDMRLEIDVFLGRLYDAGGAIGWPAGNGAGS